MSLIERGPFGAVGLQQRGPSQKIQPGLCVAYLLWLSMRTNMRSSILQALEKPWVLQIGLFLLNGGMLHPSHVCGSRIAVHTKSAPRGRFVQVCMCCTHTSSGNGNLQRPLGLGIALDAFDHVSCILEAARRLQWGTRVVSALHLQLHMHPQCI